MNPQFIVRDAVRQMPYRYRDQGLTAMEKMVVQRLLAMTTAILGAAAVMPIGMPQQMLIMVGVVMFAAILRMCVVPAPIMLPINGVVGLIVFRKDNVGIFYDFDERICILYSI